MKFEPITLCCDSYYMNNKTGRIEIVNGKLIKNECYTTDLLSHPCPKCKDALSILTILADRVLCESRCEKIMLDSMGLTHYNIWSIFKANHGVDVDDFIWFKFDDDPIDICWDDVRVR